MAAKDKERYEKEKKGSSGAAQKKDAGKKRKSEAKDESKKLN
jgi:hypothetical protein